MSEVDADIIRDLDAPPENGLDSIFVLPDNIAADTRILGWYNEMVRQLRQEASGLPMTSLQFGLMERIAYTYANMRYQEFNNPDLNERVRQANQDSWQKMLDQFNRLLEKHNDTVVNERMGKALEVINSALERVSDPVEKQAIRRQLSEDFAAIGM